MDEINVTLAGIVSTGPQVQGVQYMSAAQRDAHLSSIQYDAVMDALGNILAQSRHAITAQEQAVIDAQMVRFGPNRGMTLGAVKKRDADLAVAVRSVAP